MLNELFVREISGLAVKAAGVQTIPFGQDVIHIGPDGKPVTMLAHRDRAHKAHDLDSLIQFANRFTGSSVWYDRAGVTCLADDSTRRDKMTLAFAFSPQLALLLKWESGAGKLTPAEAIFIFRTMFKHALPNNGRNSIIDQLRAVRWKVNQSGTTETAHGKASVGKAIETEITGVEAIPEEIVLDVPIFASRFTHTAMIEVAVDPDPTTQKIGFVPIPGSCERAICGAEAAIGAYLAEGLTSKLLTLGQP